MGHVQVMTSQIFYLNFYELQDYKETSDYISECEKNIAYINAINEIRHSSNVVALEKTKKLFLGFAGFRKSTSI